MMNYKSFIHKLSRKKYVDFDSAPLPRVLGLIDLTALGVGSTVGIGFYILAGQVARDIAGPAVTICFLVAGIASVFSGLCYAEFGARVPKAGSAYVYSYVCVGEFVSFVIGWNLILEYVIGTASVARGYSGYIDTLFNNSISEAFKSAMPMNVGAFSAYPDFLAFGLVMAVAILLIVGVKESTQVNNVFTLINIFVILYTIIAGCTKINIDNWNLTLEQLNYTVCDVPRYPDDDVYEPGDWGSGGFAPYGFNGIMQGAATCFFGFVGFDVIATTGEETIKPERNIPLSICISLLIIFIAYFGISAVLTLALPYCLEDPDAALIEFFKFYDMNVSMWIVSIGAIFGFSASLLGVIFPMPRIIYAMSGDGLIFRFLGTINKRFKTPLIATILSSLLAALMALIFDINDLVDMMSIGTLMAYTIVSVCVMLLRYNPAEEEDDNKDADSEFKYKSGRMVNENMQSFTPKEYFQQLFNSKGLTRSNDLTSSLVNYATLIYCIVCFIFALFLVIFQSNIANGDPAPIFFIVLFGVLSVAIVVIIWRQPTSNKRLTFKVPFVPWLPAFSAFINLYLMCNLSTATWIRFIVWMAIGLLIYAFYGMRNSSGYIDTSDLLPDFKNEKFIIPTLQIQPPTPSPSRLGSPTDTVKPPPERRASIIDSPLVTGEWAVKEFGSRQTSITEESEDIEDTFPTDTEVDAVVATTNIDLMGVAKVQENNIEKSSSITEDLPSENEILPPASIVVITENETSSSYDKKKNKNVTDLVLTEKSSSDEETVESSSKDSPPSNSNSVFIVPKTSSESAPPTPHVKSVPVHVYDHPYISNSVPGTPIINKRHAKISLRRACSFEFIPPSAPDSPHAKKIKDFYVIPVFVPGDEHDSPILNIPQNTPQISTNPNTNLFEDAISNELNVRLVNLQNEQKNKNIYSSSVGIELLDTIRERGESKISSAGDDNSK